jgi:hypothetical protein
MRPALARSLFVIALLLPAPASAAVTKSTTTARPHAGPAATKAHRLTPRQRRLRAAHLRHLRRVRAARLRACRRRAAAWNRRHPHAKRHTCVHRRRAVRHVKRRPKAAHPRTPASAPAKAPTTGDAAAHAASSGGAAGWSGFGAGHWPGANWRPYAASSPFNAAIGGAPSDARSAQLVSAALQWGAPSSIVVGTSGTSGDFGHPVYWAQPSDPSYTLHATESWGRAPIEGMRIPVPAAARPAGGSDGHLTVVTPDGWEYDLWQSHAPPAGGGTLTFGWGGRTRVDGDGLGSRATASHFGSLAGVVRPEELAAGHVDHALFIVLKCTSGHVAPAQGDGAQCSGAPPMGTRFQLTLSDAQIAALAVPAWKKAILGALARYGGYVGDTGGSGFGVMIQSSSTYTSFGAPDPFVALARANGVAAWQGTYALNLAAGVDWAHALRAVAP